MWKWLTNEDRYTTGHAINFACCVTLVTVAASLIAYMLAENKRRGRGERDYRLESGPSEGVEKELFELELGWMHPSHRFQL